MKQGTVDQPQPLVSEQFPSVFEPMEVPAPEVEFIPVQIGPTVPIPVETTPGIGAEATPETGRKLAQAGGNEEDDGSVVTITPVVVTPIGPTFVFEIEGAPSSETFMAPAPEEEDAPSLLSDEQGAVGLRRRLKQEGEGEGEEEDDQAPSEESLPLEQRLGERAQLFPGLTNEGGITGGNSGRRLKQEGEGEGEEEENQAPSEESLPLEQRLGERAQLFPGLTNNGR